MRKRRGIRRLLVGFAATLWITAIPAPADDWLERVRDYRDEHQLAIAAELFELLEIPNVASDEENIRRNAAHLVGMLESRGIAARLLESPGSPPAVLGELEVPGATRTVVFYSHYDGQPVVPEQWASDPWTPTVRSGRLDDGAEVVAWPPEDGRIDPEWRIYARSASDDKSPIVAMLAALDALRAAGRQPSVNLKFFFEGEEEAGSPHLAELLGTHAEALAADVWLFCDGPVHQSRRGQVVFGVRGSMGLELTVYGPNRPLHSGHYGNWAPNPGALAADLVRGLRDPDGTILIDGFYDDVRPISEAGRRALASVPSVDEELRHDLALAATEADDAPLMERLLLPALNVRGIEVGRVGAQARNVISTEGRISLGFRLVPDQSPERVRALVEAELGRDGWHVVHEEPSMELRRQHERIVWLDWEGGYPALRTPLDLPISRAVIAAASEGRGEAVIEVPTLGGSLPLYLFDEILEVPLVIVPMVNHDNNQHGKDENLRFANLWQGIDMYAALMARLGELW
ncbi:MAG: M20/M25/M40 family metallo-hydrolase [Thermoanaerobaculia bacterium]|nr:M20/M25/M40 family metallo-hydrolase [Thermoanaerobaculia bacterium]